MRRIQIGPFNRVEGDLEVRLTLEDAPSGLETIQAAEVNSPMFRGFEQVLVGRKPMDALAIVPRICGICSVAQSAAAARALANLSGIQMLPNGALAQQMVLASENLSDHLSHFYLFFMPDFTRASYRAMPWFAETEDRFAAQKGRSATEWLAVRARWLHITGTLSGRWPHTLALQPGGTTRAVTRADILQIQSRLRECRGFMERTLLGDRLEHMVALRTVDDLWAWADAQAGSRESDFALFVRLAQGLGLASMGQATDRFMAYGSPTHAGGLWQPNQPDQVEALRAEHITEDSHHAWLADQGPIHPNQGETLVQVEKPDAYTWCKAPRYVGQVVEVGALARQLVMGHPLLRNCVATHGGSVLARVVGRVVEAASLLIQMEQDLKALVLNEPFCHDVRLPDEGSAVGLVEAARGGLGHWLTVKNGVIQRYQIIAPTTWNFSPRDTAGQPGPLEQALVGLPVGDTAPPSVQHVVRSFDPCMVCTVH